MTDNHEKERAWFSGVLLEAAPGARRRRLVSMGISSGGQAVAMLLLVVLAAYRPARMQVMNLTQEVLYEPPPPTPPPPKPRVEPVRRPTPPPEPPKPQVTAIKLNTFAPPPQPKPELKRVEVAAMTAPAPVLKAAEAPDLLDHHSPTPLPPVQLNNLPTAAPVTLQATKAPVQTGGFGSPSGLAATAHTPDGNVAQLGSFDLPDGSGQGNGRGGASGQRGVAAGGFGSGGSGQGSGGNGNGAGGTARLGGFADGSQPVAARAAAAAPAEPTVTPMEITYKPKPDYTPEAVAARIEGDVLLNVVFQADGSLQIVGVSQPLGHGLDAQAIAVARRIRFKPATRNGVAVDTAALLRITFQLAE